MKSIFDTGKNTTIAATKSWATRAFGIIGRLYIHRSWTSWSNIGKHWLSPTGKLITTFFVLPELFFTVSVFFSINFIASFNRVISCENLTSVSRCSVLFLWIFLISIYLKYKKKTLHSHAYNEIKVYKKKYIIFIIFIR